MIKGGVQNMCLLWEQHYQEEYWVFILINARNAFNEENQTEMLWAVWHEWPSATQFTFKFYCHWSTLMERDL